MSSSLRLHSFAPAAALTLLTLIAAPPARGQQASVGPDRGGFTLLVSLGAGVQNDTAIEESGFGLGGLNLGIGGFLKNDVALMFRVSGTNVKLTFSEAGFEESFDQVSGVGAVSVQYWVNDRFNIEAGPGLGFWSTDGGDDTGFGLFAGAGLTVLNKGRHNLQLGIEYAPAFTEGGAVHNAGLTLGYQLL